VHARTRMKWLVWDVAMYPFCLIYLVEAEGSLARTSLSFVYNNDGQHLAQPVRTFNPSSKKIQLLASSR